ncbi:methyltransferase domain-containing protein [Cohnella thailandensis]|uniref:Methyltransferase domain-containing protein n=1 Tax=Cohnella thailandensis TaxID=557557 RepID=A0A841T7D3_9BACL|nr:methyltransferase domain-containing protein [Cohnella thailandensis]MBP1973029.1 ubiquinone/menaquinone biosynthesis C-methylase UbiE/DNA-binding transcriptional MerR regulator [Cohnella thailandensis]
MRTQDQNHDYFTTGQIAKETGLTLRTLRYYDQIGLLKPSGYGQASKRLYNRSDLIKLQQIQTLKYIGLTLNEIKRIVTESRVQEQNLGSSLRMQREIILQKTADLQFVLKAINEATDQLIHSASDEEVDWKAFKELIQAVHVEKDWVQQYHLANRLQTRIELYEKCGVNKQGWHRWFFEHLGSRPNLRILEIGCGEGTLWSKNADRIPESWKITVTDLSPGMLEEARRKIRNESGQFKFVVVDIQSIPFHDEDFDIVIANNMLYHVPDIPTALAEIFRVMKPGAQLYTSTMSKRHLQEIELIMKAFDPEMKVLDPIMERFELDHGHELLAKMFADVKTFRYEDQLIVNDVQPLLSYMTSTPMNAREKLVGAKRKQFIAYIQGKLNLEGCIRITMDSGFFLARK